MPFARAMTREPAGRMATTAFAEAMPSAACGRTRPLRIPVECGNLPFLIRRDGTWLYRGSPINRKELVCLFASVLKRSARSITLGHNRLASMKWSRPSLP